MDNKLAQVERHNTFTDNNFTGRYGEISGTQIEPQTKADGVSTHEYVYNKI